MKRDPSNPNVVAFEPNDVMDMLLEKLRANGIGAMPLALQIIVRKPFGAGMTVHSEVPTLAVILQKGAEG